MAAATASPMLDIARIATTAATGAAGAVAVTIAPPTTTRGTKRPRDANPVGEISSSPSMPLHSAPQIRSANRKVLAVASPFLPSSLSAPSSSFSAPLSALSSLPSALSAPPSALSAPLSALSVPPSAEMCTPPTPSSAPRGFKRRLAPWDENDDTLAPPPAVPPTPSSVLRSAQCLSASPRFPRLAPPPSPLLLEEVDSDSTCSSPVNPHRLPQTPRLSAQPTSAPAETPAEDSRKRQRAQPSQVQRLEEAFQAAVAAQEGSAHGEKAQAAGQVLVSAERQWQLAAELGLLPRQVSAWFQTRQLEWQAEQGEAELRKMRAAHAGLAEQCCEMRNDYELLKGDYAQMLLHIAKILNKITQIENLLNADERKAKQRSPYVQPHQTGADENRQQAVRGNQKKENAMETAQKSAHCAQTAIEIPAEDKPQWGSESQQLVSASASADTIGSEGAAPVADLSSPQRREVDLSGTFLDGFEELSGSLGGQQDFFEAATAAAEAPLREMGLGEAQNQGHLALQAHQVAQQQPGKAHQPRQLGPPHLGRCIIRARVWKRPQVRRRLEQEARRQKNHMRCVGLAWMQI
ncbi:unnamed protein product [Closterium sp. Yama58-4]|nr:unnamed protein product [Closterium sp. Yama58-4]